MKPVMKPSIEAGPRSVVTAEQLGLVLGRGNGKPALAAFRILSVADGVVTLTDATG